MARRRRNRAQAIVAPPVSGLNPVYIYSETRDASAVASAEPSPGQALTFPVLISPRSVRSLMPIEDRRTWHPDRYRPAAMLSRPRHRLTILGAPGAKRPRYDAKRTSYLPDYPRRASAVPTKVHFKGAPSVLICIRRKQRREVLFARGGPAGPPRPFRKPRWNQYSKIACRRS